MTKKDYIIIASTINSWIRFATLDNKLVEKEHALNLVDMLMIGMQDDNKRFDHKKFIEACFKETSVPYNGVWRI